MTSWSFWTARDKSRLVRDGLLMHFKHGHRDCFLMLKVRYPDARVCPLSAIRPSRGRFLQLTLRYRPVLDRDSARPVKDDGFHSLGRHGDRSDGGGKQQYFVEGRDGIVIAMCNCSLRSLPNGGFCLDLFWFFSPSVPEVTTSQICRRRLSEPGGKRRARPSGGALNTV